MTERAREHDGGVRAEVTRILREAEGAPESAGELMPLVYDELRVIAAQRMREERAGHTLQATALVHEACARLLGPGQMSFENRAHFFRTAAEAMRRILIDHARRRGAEKRGGANRERLPLSVVDLAQEHDPEMVMALDEAMTRLEAEDPRAYEIVQLRFFAGLSVEQAGETLGVSARTVQREWAYARAWLARALGGEA